MSPGLLRSIIAGVFAFHGIGQIMGVLPALALPFFEKSESALLQNWSSHSWLLTPTLGENMARIFAVVLFGIPFVGFVASALAMMNWLIPHEVWRSLALTSTVFSILALVFYWNGLILFFPHKVGDIAVNLTVLIGLLVLHWPAETDLGF